LTDVSTGGSGGGDKIVNPITDPRSYEIERFCTLAMAVELSTHEAAVPTTDETGSPLSMQKAEVMLDDEFVCARDRAEAQTHLNTAEALDRGVQVHTIDWCREHVGHPGCPEAIKADPVTIIKEVKETAPPTVDSELQEMSRWEKEACDAMLLSHTAVIPEMCHSHGKNTGIHTDAEIRKSCMDRYMSCVMAWDTTMAECTEGKSECLSVEGYMQRSRRRR
jgi:hypothetical protein